VILISTIFDLFGAHIADQLRSEIASLHDAHAHTEMTVREKSDALQALQSELSQRQIEMQQLNEQLEDLQDRAQEAYVIQLRFKTTQLSPFRI
jgi:uncharacterized coiled-coil protein SlyX